MASRPLHFLLIEDDDDHALIITRSLERSAAVRTVDRMADGVQALDYLQKRAGPLADVPDVILLDLKLPLMDGHEVLAAIKADPRLKTIPVVVITTSDAESDRARAYEQHANSYLVKPVGFEPFRQMVEDLTIYWSRWNRPAPSPPPESVSGL